MIGVLGFGAAGGFVGWMVAMFTAPMDLDALTVIARDVTIGVAVGLGGGIVVLS
jgi:hypothetical protein